MEKAYYAEQMRRIDRIATEIGKIPSIVLMENAAAAVEAEVLRVYEGGKICVICGKGNNGGDGFALARRLKNRGLPVAAVLTCDRSFKGDALINYEIYTAMGGELFDYEKGCLIGYSLIVDAIFGTGIHGVITGTPFDAIEEINRSKARVIAVDIPSGAEADTGRACGTCVRADITVTLAGHKLAEFLYPAADFFGKTVLANIQIPEYITDTEQHINVVNSCMELLPQRGNNSHKGSFGKLLIIGGSLGMAGAVCMSAKAALRCGVGTVTVAVPECINDIVQKTVTEAMTIPLPEKDGKISENAFEHLDINRYDAVAIGMGLGRCDALVGFLEGVIARCDIPILIDADGLFALSKARPDILNGKTVVITPHSGEFARLSKKTAEEIESDRIGAAREFDKGLTLVLKGHHTLITAPDGGLYINTGGNHGMATAGSGDVLSGIIGSLLSQGMNSTDAAVCGVHMHALAGDYAVKTQSASSLIATDIIDALKHIFPVENS